MPKPVLGSNSFNSRSHAASDVWYSIPPLRVLFQLTLARGERPHLCWTHARREVSTHARTRRATPIVVAMQQSMGFQLTLARGERLVQERTTKHLVVSTHARTRRATLETRESLRKLAVSTHARTRRATRLKDSKPINLTFQLTLARGERLLTWPHLRAGPMFQLTLARGERQQSPGARGEHQVFQLTLARGERPGS